MEGKKSGRIPYIDAMFHVQVLYDFGKSENSLLWIIVPYYVLFFSVRAERKRGLIVEAEHAE